MPKFFCFFARERGESVSRGAYPIETRWTSQWMKWGGAGVFRPENVPVLKLHRYLAGNCVIGESPYGAVEKQPLSVKIAHLIRKFEKHVAR